MQFAHSHTWQFSTIRSKEALQTLIGFLLLVASAQIVIPISPVPVTLQSVAVMLIGFTFATRPALLSVASYLFLGSLGMPIFSDWGFGLARLAGPSGGYLFGFFVAVLVMTMIRRMTKKDSLISTVAVCSIGTACIFAPGLLWLSTYVGMSQAISVGLIPFLIPGAVKTLLLSLSLQYVGKAKLSH